MRLGPDFDALLERFGSQPSRPVALAVSGGSDSIGLLALAHDWHQRTGQPLLVLSVNHNLRPEAAAETESVRLCAAKLGHMYRTLEWTTPRASQNAARLARYRLLADAARQAGALCLLTGHTLDDVIETALIRRRRGVRSAAIAGPALVSPTPVWPEGRNLTLIRPLIHTKRSSIRDHLSALQWTWIEDPSNDKPEFERVRFRQFLATHPNLKSLAARFVATQQKQRAIDLKHIGQALLDVHVHSDGLIDTKDANLSDSLIKILARCASGNDREPRAHAVQALRTNLNQAGQRQTLGGAWFQRKPVGYLIGRDPSDLTSEKCSSHGDVFDGRFLRSAEGGMPAHKDRAFLVRENAPCGHEWKEIISERIQHIATCYQTPLVNPVQT